MNPHLDTAEIQDHQLVVVAAACTSPCTARAWSSHPTATSCTVSHPFACLSPAFSMCSIPEHPLLTGEQAVSLVGERPARSRVSRVCCGACWTTPTPSASAPSTGNSASNSPITPTAGRRAGWNAPCTWGSCRRTDTHADYTVSTTQ